MSEVLKSQLTKRITAEFEHLNSLDDGSDEKAEATEHLIELYKLHIEEKKVDNENLDKSDRRYMDEEQQKRSIKQQNWDRYFKIGIEILGIVVPPFTFAFLMARGLRFEETGTYTSTTMKNLIRFFKPTR